jgi:hypothetical protein
MIKQTLSASVLILATVVVAGPARADDDSSYVSVKVLTSDGDKFDIHDVHADVHTGPVNVDAKLSPEAAKALDIPKAAGQGGGALGDALANHKYVDGYIDLKTQQAYEKGRGERQRRGELRIALAISSGRSPEDRSCVTAQSVLKLRVDGKSVDPFGTVGDGRVYYQVPSNIKKLAAQHTVNWRGTCAPSLNTLSVTTALEQFDGAEWNVLATLDSTSGQVDELVAVDPSVHEHHWAIILERAQAPVAAASSAPVAAKTLTNSSQQALAHK